MEVVPAYLFYLLLLVPWHQHANALGGAKDVSLHITRQNTGDLFTPEGATSCQPESCVGLSSGTAAALPGGGNLCNCQCHPHLPAFREDLRICVDDIHECVLAPFVGGSTSQQIPFVFLPLKGQIIHPSKEISFTGIQTPVCAVSGAKFLTEAGWVELRNPIDTDVPFRLYRDEGRTFLQWVGESELRTKMSGRLVLVYLMCRELATTESVVNTVSNRHTLFSPCVAFRVVGSPTKYLNNVSEVAFFPDAHSTSTSSDHLSVSEYVAIGICSVLLGLIYVASVFLYLHLRKRNNKDASLQSSSISPLKKSQEDQNLSAAEEGVVKNNPLLSIVGHHFQQAPDTVYSDSTGSDTDISPDIIQHSNEERKKSTQITSALIHPHYSSRHQHQQQTSSQIEQNYQDLPSIEKLPEENVSIVETLEGKDERMDSFKALSGTVRKKLYFNPAYFEPQLLIAPPPAALEFLAKIREVITIAKQKMEAKKFSPSLMGIPEEEQNYAIDAAIDSARNQLQSISRRSSLISLKRENSRRKTCTGCPGCEPQDFTKLCGKLPEFPSMVACQNCSTANNIVSDSSKQRSIRKWLEDVPILKETSSSSSLTSVAQKEQMSAMKKKRLRSPTRSLPPDEMSARRKIIMSSSVPSRPSSERAISPDSDRRTRRINQQQQRKAVKARAPPPPPQKKISTKMNFPDMIHEAIKVDSNKCEIIKKEEELRVPTLTKKQMKAVIDEFAMQRGIAASAVTTTITKHERHLIEYETDSLERSNKGYCTPTEYADISSSCSQPSPSLSAALPMDEEMTMRNAIFNTKTGNMTISKINVDQVLNGEDGGADGNDNNNNNDDHDYELIVLKKGSLKKHGFYKLPELLQRTNGYSLVSEVYVNNGYNYGSAPSSPSESNCSTLEKRTLNVRYNAQNSPQVQAGKLLIEVADCPDNYLPVEDSDSFEPDTLDRKPHQNISINNNPAKIPQICPEDQMFIDSLERPQQILLRTNGSFKKSPNPSTIEIPSNFTRGFGSLREIYEAKTKALKMQQQPSLDSFNDSVLSEEGRLLTLEERHSKRQRRLTTTAIIPPDLIPPPPKEAIYEHPKSPRKIIICDAADLPMLKPPLPPKNANGRSVSRNTVGKTDTPATRKSGGENCQPEEEGYQSNDSSSKDKESESEESLDEGHSESGAESVETHSVFFGSFRKPITHQQYLAFGSLDSGVDAGPNSNDLNYNIKSISLQNFPNKSILFSNG